MLNPTAEQKINGNESWINGNELWIVKKVSFN